MRRALVRVMILLITLILVIPFSGCDKVLDKLFEGYEIKDRSRINSFSNIEEIERNWLHPRPEQITEILGSGDKDKLKELFAEEALDGANDIDKGLDYVFDLFDGQVLQIRKHNFDSHSRAYPERCIQMIDCNCFIETDKDNYILSWRECIVYTGMKERIGLYNLALLREGDDSISRLHAFPGIEYPDRAPAAAAYDKLTSSFDEDLLSSSLLSSLSSDDIDDLKLLADITDHWKGVRAYSSGEEDNLGIITGTGLWESSEGYDCFVFFENRNKGAFALSYSLSADPEEPGKISGLKVSPFQGKMPSVEKLSASGLSAEPGKVEGLSSFVDDWNNKTPSVFFEGEEYFLITSVGGYELPKGKPVGYTDSNEGGLEVYKTTGFGSEIIWVGGQIYTKASSLESVEDTIRNRTAGTYHYYIVGYSPSDGPVEFDSDLFWKIYDLQFTEATDRRPSRAADYQLRIRRTSEDEKIVSWIGFYNYGGDLYTYIEVNGDKSEFGHKLSPADSARILEAVGR